MSASVLREDVLERLRAVADLEDRHADAGQRHEIALRLLENGHGQDRGAGGKVVDALDSRSHELVIDREARHGTYQVRLLRGSELCTVL